VAEVDRVVPEATRHPVRAAMVVLEPLAISLEPRLPTVAVAVAVNAQMTVLRDPEATEAETEALHQLGVLGVMDNSAAAAAALETEI